MHPYENLKPDKFWKSHVSDKSWSDIDFHEYPKFLLRASDKIATAGSCFAQNLNKAMPSFGIRPYISEKPHPLLDQSPDLLKSYSVFSARYGNIYTVSQMLELVEQALGCRDVIHEYSIQNDRVFDLLRPSIQPNGFASVTEARADRIYHLFRVKKMLQDADAFIFTLGLTETWINSDHGFSYPVCPGTVKGSFDKSKHLFVQQSHAGILTQLTKLVSLLKAANSGVRVIITVSPVHLVATNTNYNVLVASSFSKSVLRSVAGEVAEAYSFVDYFPSFEIISSGASFGQFLDDSLRGANDRGVNLVMKKFFGTYFPKSEFKTTLYETDSTNDKAHNGLIQNVFDVECDELFNDINKINNLK